MNAEIEKKLSSINYEIKELEKQLDFLEGIDELQIGIENISSLISAGISFTIEKALQEINFISVLSNLELSYLSKQIVVSQSYREKQFFIKLAHLNVFEFSETYKNKLKLLKTLIPIREDYNKAFKHISKYVASLKKRHSFEDNIAYIRNKMAAHKDLPLTEYFSQSKLLKEDDCTLMISEFKNFHSLLFMFLALLQECHYKGIPQDFDVESVFEVLSYK